MPFATYTPWSQVEAAAMAFAARLDVLLAETSSEALEEALHEVGNLLGGLGCRGFSADLRAHLERVEADLLADAHRYDYSPGRGGNDPDSVFSTRLSDAIDRAREDDASDWLEDATRIIARLQPLAEAA